MAEPDTPSTPPRRTARALALVIAALLAFPLAFGAFWVARESGAAHPLCGDRPGSHYPACALPPPFGTGAPPTTATGFQP